MEFYSIAIHLENLISSCERGIVVDIVDVCTVLSMLEFEPLERNIEYVR